MRALNLLVLLLTPIILFGQQAKTHEDTSLVSLKQRKAKYESYAYNHRKNIVFLVKISGKKDLLKVKEGDWPDDMEFIYTILKDENGKIMIITQSPYSQSGDWYIECKHYFNSNGKTFAFSKRETVFDDSVKGEVAMETFLWFYNDNFEVTEKDYRLTDGDDKLIKKNKNDFDFRDFKEQIYSNTSNCLKAFNINLLNK